MIEVRVERAVNGVLARLSSAGHARADHSAACVGVSTLLKASAQALADRPELTMTGTAPHPGMMQIELIAPQDTGAEYALGVTEVLIQGLRELAEGFPEEVQLSIGRTDTATAGR